MLDGRMEGAREEVCRGGSLESVWHREREVVGARCRHRTRGKEGFYLHLLLSNLVISFS